MPQDQESGDRTPADGGVQKVGCYENSRRNPLKTLGEKRPFSAPHVYQAKGTIFRNIRLPEAQMEHGASGLSDEDESS